MESNLVEMRDIRFAWDDRRRENNGVQFQLNIESFFIQLREKLFLQGPSGSGKSTLVGLICGTILAQSGAVCVNSILLKELTGPQLDRHRANNIGIIYQMFNLIPYMSALENVLLPLEFSKIRKLRTGSSNSERRKEALRLLERLGLDAERDGNSYPGNLSVGQQQRVAAARALIGNPGLIIADEPTSSLDDKNQQNFLDLLFSEVEENHASLLMISHNRGLAENFDRIICLENGSLGKGT
jgi:putative ABC transport system ATP-binding protein